MINEIQINKEFIETDSTKNDIGEYDYEQIKNSTVLYTDRSTFGWI